jgi:hypothetical protein
VSALNFSGSPPILLPRRAAARWRGIFDPTGQPRELSVEDPQTDHDKACAASRVSNSILRVDGEECLVLYTESDEHLWVDGLGIIVCGNWVPSRGSLDGAEWIGQITWHCSEKYPILLNSSVNASPGLLDREEFLQISLLDGLYVVDRALVCEGENEAIVHRFRKK